MEDNYEGIPEQKSKASQAEYRKESLEEFLKESKMKSGTNFWRNPMSNPWKKLQKNPLKNPGEIINLGKSQQELKSQEITGEIPKGIPKKTRKTPGGIPFAISIIIREKISGEIHKGITIGILDGKPENMQESREELMGEPHKYYNSWISEKRIF